MAIIASAKKYTVELSTKLCEAYKTYFGKPYGPHLTDKQFLLKTLYYKIC